MAGLSNQATLLGKFKPNQLLVQQWDLTDRTAVVMLQAGSEEARCARFPCFLLLACPLPAPGPLQQHCPRRAARFAQELGCDESQWHGME